MKIYKPERLLAWILAVAMIVQACPVSAFAADYTDDAMFITEQEESQDAEAPEETVAAADETLELEQAEPAEDVVEDFAAEDAVEDFAAEDAVEDLAADDAVPEEEAVDEAAAEEAAADEAVVEELEEPDEVTVETADESVDLAALDDLSIADLLDESLTDVLPEELVGADDALTLNLNLYNYDDTTALAFPADFSSDNVYAVVWVDDGGEFRDLPDNTPWAVLDLTGNLNGSPFSVNSFSNSPWYNNNSVSYSSLTDEQKAALKVRVIHTGSQPSLGGLKGMTQSEFEELWNGGFEGYDLSTAHPSGMVSLGNYEVNFILGNTKEHDVVLHFTDGQGAIPGGQSYILLDATSADGNNHYYYVVEAEADGSSDKVYLPIEGNWSGTQPFSNNWRNITASVIRPKAGKTITTGGNKPNDADYYPAYVIGDYNYAYAGRQTEIDESQHIQHDEYVFNLTTASYEDAIDPYDVLGDAAEFGIIADRYEQDVHTETNMAVNSFKDERGNIDLDGAGDAVMPFYIGSIDEGSKLWISEKTEVGVDLFITQDIHDNKLNLTTTKPVEEFIMEESAINSYVNGLIAAFTDNSATMAGKTTISPELSGNNKTLDLTQFPDNTTIYVDCTNMQSIISAGGWHINKYPGQSVVFNMPGTGTVNVGEFYVHLFDENGTETEVVQSTTTPMNGDDEKNKRVDEVIMEHITFNAYEASALDLNNASGLFLAPNADRVTQSNGAGWIATGGTVESHAEWHFYRHTRRYKSKGDFALSGQKKIVDADGVKDYSEFSSMEFKFELYECDADGVIADDAEPLETVTADLNGEFSFSKLKYTQEDVPEGQTETFYYVIKEVVPDEENDKGVIYDAAPVYVKVVATDNGTETISFVISTKGEGDWTVIPASEDDPPVYDIGDFSNTYEEENGSFKITKAVTENSEAPSDNMKKILADTYEFTIYTDADCTEPYLEDGEPKTVELTIGEDGQEVTEEVTDMPKGDYWLKETTPTNGSSPVENKIKVTVVAGKTGDEAPVVNFTNNINTGDLEVNKKLVSDAAADADAEFTFTITLSDTTINGTFGEMTFADGVATVTLKGGEKATATGLPTGITYTITEEEAEGFQLTNKTGEEGTISKTLSEAEFTNTRDTGNLKVSKTVVSKAAADKNQEFTFTVTLSDTTISGTYGDMIFENGVATVKLKGGEEATAEGLPTDITYEVTEVEANQNNFVTEATGASGTITKDETPEAKFTNTKAEGGLSVSKTVISDAAADNDQEFTFTVTLGDTSINGEFGGMTFVNGVATFTLKNGESKAATGLPQSTTYTITEADADGFTLTGSTGDSGSITKTVSTAEFTNTRETGDLEVSKKVVSDAAADKNQKFIFTVTLSDTTIGGTEGKDYGDMTFVNGVATVELKDGETAKAEGLPTGIGYTVTEENAEGFEVTGKTGDTGTISKTLSTAEFTNTRDKGDLKVSKTLVSDAAADVDVEFTFTVTLEDETINGEYGDMTFKDGVATVNLKGGQELAATGLPTGVKYTVTEADAEGFELTAKTGDSGTISKETSTASFTNARETGDLEVSKTVISDAAADKDREFTFTVTLSDTTIGGADGKEYGGMTFINGVATVTLKHNESVTAEGLPTGITYTVTEANADGFELTGKTGDTGTISKTESKAEFTNTRETGDLKLSKTVISDAAADDDAEFTFTVTLGDTTISGTYGDMTFAQGVATVELKGGESKEATGLPTDITYTIEEASATGFELTAKTGETGTISTKKSEASFTNTRETGGLTVTKSVESSTASDKNKYFHFKVTLSDTTISGTYGEMEFTDGIASFTLKDGESKAASGLPTSVTYTVEEEDANTDNFVTTSTGDIEGTIEKDATPEAAFVNTKVEGGLAVTKSVISVLTADKEQTFSFKVTLDDKTVTGTYGGMEFENGVAEFTLKDGESITAEGLAKGIGYKVEEEADGKFTTTSTGETGTISDTEVSTAAFVNTRNTGSLEVSKTVVSDRAADASQTFKFTIELDDNTVNGTFGDMEFKNGVAEVELKGGDSAAAEGLPTEIGYTVTEAEVEGFELTGKTGDTGTISTEKSAAAFTNTRETGDLKVSKVVISDAKADKDVEFTFTVTLTDTTINGEYGDMVFTDGVAVLILKGGQSLTAKGLPTEIGYTVTEETTDGFEMSGKTGDTGEISTTPSEAEITNTRYTGGLKVSKSVFSSTESDKKKEFTFVVQLDDESISGEFGDMTFKNGKAAFKLADGEYALATDLPATGGYTVIEREANENNFVTTYTGDIGQITKDETPEAAFVNTKVEGGLAVTKSVKSDLTADKSEAFRFRVTLDDTSVNGTYKEMTFKDGVAEFSLKDGESLIAEGLAKGIGYTVEEEADDRFVTTSTGETGTIDEKKPATAEFVNTRKTGDLEVSKKLVSDRAADAEKEFTFTVSLSDKAISGPYGDMTFENGEATVKLKGGQSATAEGLPTDVSYTVTEAEADGFKLTAKTGDAGTISTEKSEAVFTNTREVGDLTISKILISEATADKDVAFNFTVQLDDKTINGTYGDMEFTDGAATVMLKGGEYATAKGLPTDVRYIVTEESTEGFELTEKVGDSGTIHKNPLSAVITNTRDLGGLTVSKSIVSDRTADKDQVFTFTVKLDDEAIGGEEGKAYGGMFFKAGVATVELKGGESVTATDLPTGIGYTVTEAEAEGFELTAQTGEIGIISKEAPTAAFTNTREVGDLTVSKTVVSDKAADKDQIFTFTVTLDDTGITGTYGDMTFANGVATVELKGGESKTAKGLPTDIGYTVTEAEAKGFELTAKTGDTGTISKTEATAAFTNTREVGGFTVSKTVDKGTDADKTTQEFNFIVTLDDTTISGTYGEMEFKEGVAEFTLKNGEVKKAEGLPTTVTYKVEEEAAGDFVTTYTGETGVIEKDATPEAAFINSKVVGGLSVTKSVVSDMPADKTQKFHFKVTLTNGQNISGTYGPKEATETDKKMEFKDGVAEFDLANGEAIIAEGLPKGLEYKVEETVDEKFIVTSTGETGTIDDVKPSIAAFVNTRKTGDLTVSKKVVSNRKAYADRTFKFTVTLTELPLTGKYGDMEFTEGVATVELKGGESKTATGLPIDAVYTVTEAETAGYKLTAKTGDTGTISTEKATAEFTNTELLGSLKLSKKVKVDKIDIDAKTNKEAYNKKFSVRITYTDSEGKLYYLTEKNGLISAEEKPEIATSKASIITISMADGVKEFKDLPVGKYTVKELQDGDNVKIGDLVYDAKESTADVTVDVTEDLSGDALLVNCYKGVTKVTVEKKWVDSTGKAIAWPTGATVEITITRLGDKNFKKVVTLTRDHQKETILGLPAFDAAGKAYTYQFAETNVTGVSNFVGIKPVIDDKEMYTLYVLFKNRLQNEEKKTTVVRRSAGTTSVRSTSTSRAVTVKTGDESAIMLWLVLMVMSAASIGVTLKKRKKSA